MQGYIIPIAAAITLIGTIYVAYSSRKTNEEATSLASRVDLNKAEALAKAEVVKTKTDAETKRLEQLLEGQQDFIKLLQDENKQQRTEMLTKDKLHREEMIQIRGDVAEISRLMSVCVEERSKFKYEMEKQLDKYNALEAQMQNKRERKANADLRKKGDDITIKGKVTGEIQ